MEKNPVSEMIETSLAKIKDMVDVNTVIGEPIVTVDGITLIPVSKVTLGFGGGGTEFPVKEKNGLGMGNGAGMKIEPVGFLSINNGNIRMINISQPAETTVDRAIELVPEIIDRVEEFIEKRKAEKE